MGVGRGGGMGGTLEAASASFKKHALIRHHWELQRRPTTLSTGVSSRAAGRISKSGKKRKGGWVEGSGGEGGSDNRGKIKKKKANCVIG